MRNYDLAKTEFIVENLSGFLNGKILDLGCNEGILAEKMNLDKINYVGVDIDNSALYELTKKGFNSREVDLSKGILPFEENEFNSFLCLDILEHLQDPIRIIKELKRVTKYNGKGIISLPNDLNLTNILKVLFTSRSIVTRDTLWSSIGHLHFASVKESVKLISKNFKILEVFYLPSKYTIPILPNRIKLYLARFLPKFFAQNIIFKVLNKERGNKND